MNNKEKSEIYRFLGNFEKNVGYNFKNKELLLSALMHKTYAVKNKIYPKYDVQRMEFLGDAVLSLSVTKYLYDKYVHYREGDLSKLKSMLVAKSYQSYVAGIIGFKKYLLISSSLLDNIDKTSILCDHFEALVAGIYLDSGFQGVAKFLKRNFYKYTQIVLNRKENFINYKNIVFEYCAKNNFEIFVDLLKEMGEPNDKTFVYQVRFNKVSGIGTGKTKKEAQQNACKMIINNYDLDK